MDLHPWHVGLDEGCDFDLVDWLRPPNTFLFVGAWGDLSSGGLRLLCLGHVVLLETKIRGHLRRTSVLGRLVARPEVLVALLVHLLLLAEGVLRVLVRLVARRNHLLLELGLLRIVLLVLRGWDLC